MSNVFHLLEPRPNPGLLSLVMPAYNEQPMIPILRRELTAFLDTLPCTVEVIFVNDGSRDETLRLLSEWASEDSRIKVLGLARNFGHQIAATAGLDAASGDAVVIMDADLQDPPAVVHEMLAKYREGYEVVYGQRRSRAGETAVKRFTAWGFYRFMRSFIHKDLPPDSGDFRLVSRRCLDAVKTMRETHRFLRGMVAWVGFAQTAVLFERPARAAGETHYPLSKMIKFAWTAAVSFSAFPLRLSLAGGVIVALVGILIGLWAIVSKIFGWHTEPGWASLMFTFCLLGGAVLISNGILGEYVGRTFEEVKGRPLYVVSTSMNIAARTTPNTLVTMGAPETQEDARE